MFTKRVGVFAMVIGVAGFVVMPAIVAWRIHNATTINKYSSNYKGFDNFFVHNSILLKKIIFILYPYPYPIPNAISTLCILPYGNEDEPHNCGYNTLCAFGGGHGSVANAPHVVKNYSQTDSKQKNREMQILRGVVCASMT